MLAGGRGTICGPEIKKKQKEEVISSIPIIFACNQLKIYKMIQNLDVNSLPIQI